MKTEIEISEKSVTVKDTSRSVSVTKNRVGNNVIHIKGLTSLVGKQQASAHYLSEDDLIKHTILGMTDDGIIELSLALNYYVIEVLNKD